MDVLAGIDLGSTSLKAIFYDLNGRKVAGASRPTEKFHPNADHPEWTVWQPEQIWQGAAGAVRQAVEQLPGNASIRGVAVTGMGMDGLPVDASGEWLYPMISWHDPRTTDQMSWWQDHIGHDRQFSVGGNPLWPINSALRILWVREHEPEIYDRTAKWLLIEDFLNFMLTGVTVTDYSMASCTLLFDQHGLCWSDELLSLSGIPKELLCDLQPSGTVIGQVQASAAEKTGLPVGTPVVLGGHDHLCGTLPVGVFHPGSILDVTGTWETVITPVAAPRCDDRLRQAGMTIQAHVARGMHTIWGGSVAGEMLEWFRREVSQPGAAESDSLPEWDLLMDAAAATPAGAQGTLFLPHMSGSASPQTDPASRGAFVGLRTQAGKGELLRAIIEGLDYQMLDIVQAMQKGIDSQLDRIVAVGGGTRNSFWMQNKADVLGRPIEVPDVDEATPLGAAMLAGIGVNCYGTLEEAYERVYRPGVCYQPDAARADRYQQLFGHYQQLYHALAPLHHQIDKEFTR